jgi:hypothetical protein
MRTSIRGFGWKLLHSTVTDTYDLPGIDRFSSGHSSRFTDMAGLVPAICIATALA